MKKLQLILILFIGFCSYAQFSDDMESYTDGQPISGVHWTDFSCGGGPGCALMSTSNIAASGTLSGLIPNDNTTDAILDLGNKIIGPWTIEFWGYVPSGKEAYIASVQEVPINTYEPFAHIYFNQHLNNSGIGKIEDTALGTVTFNFPHDQWFRIVYEIDMSEGVSSATWHLFIWGQSVIPEGTPYTNALGEYPISLGGLEFLSISNSNELYVDDFVFLDGIVIFGTNDVTNTEFSIYPNPVKDQLYIDSLDLPVDTITIYTLQGQLVHEATQANIIDVSKLPAGMYFIQITSQGQSITKKFIRK